MKKTILVGISLLIAIAGTAFAEERIWPTFPDVQTGSYYETAVHRMQVLDVIKGYDNGNFGPNDSVTRGQVATILDRYNQNVINGLKQENAYLKTLACAQFQKADYQAQDYQAAWEEICGVKMQTL